jgi:hypothetical protein
MDDILDFCRIEVNGPQHVPHELLETRRHRARFLGEATTAFLESPRDFVEKGVRCVPAAAFLSGLI